MFIGSLVWQIYAGEVYIKNVEHGGYLLEMHQVLALILINDQSELRGQILCLFLPELQEWCILTISEEREVLNSFVSEM
jgi:hypothetical protein